MSYTIFINYRRDDSRAEASLVKRALIDKFGEENVFMDTAIEPGARWPTVLREKLVSANAVIAVIGPKWLRIKSHKSGLRRLDEESDWVRQELEMALGGNQNIIPLFVGGAKPPLRAELLPESIRSLSELEGITVGRDYTDHDIQPLLARLTVAGDGSPVWLKAFDIELVAQSFFESTFPAYVLDLSGCVVGWNASLGAVVGEKEAPVRGTHLAAWLMEKGHELKQLPTKSNPQDISVVRGTLKLKTNKFGRVQFDQITSPVFDKKKGGVKYYVAALSPSSLKPERREELMQAIETCLNQKLEWTKYAVAYDRVLTEYSGYKELIKLHCAAVKKKKAGRVLDLGAGTGNVTRAILNEDPDRRVVAVDSNKASLYQLSQKCREFTKRLEIQFTEIELVDLPAESTSVVIMNNVLMFLNDPEDALRRAFVWLSDGGIISIHVSKQNVSIKTLMESIEEELVTAGKFNALQDDFRIVKRQNEKFESGEVRMRCFAASELESLLSNTGFEVEEVREGVYANQGIYVRARKVRRASARPVNAK